MDTHALTLVLPVLIILPVLYFRLRRMARPQRMRLETLWVRPALMLFAAGALLLVSKPRLSDGVWFVLAAGLGAGGGWYWGKLTRLHLHPEDGTLMSTGSQAGMIVLVLLLVLRIGMRAAIVTQARTMHLDAVLLTDILIVFTALLFSVRGLEIFLRARRLMRDNS